MKIISAILICLLSAIMMTGCGPMYETRHTYKPPHSESGRMCAAQCVQSKGSCQAMCQMQSQNCIAQAKQDAVYKYEAYRSERRSHHKKVDRSISSFEDTWQCNQNCGCESNFNLCYQTCGGTVKTYRVCTAFCDQKR